MEKATLARANGCHHVINYREEDFVARVKEITKGEGCHVVYDGVGKDTARGSLDCLRPFGTYVNFGWASGPVEPISPMDLLMKGSLFMTSPGLTQYLQVILVRPEPRERLVRLLVAANGLGDAGRHVVGVLHRLDTHHVAAGIVAGESRAVADGVRSYLGLLSGTTASAPGAAA